jgi:hypothetical protein
LKANDAYLRLIDEFKNSINATNAARKNYLQTARPTTKRSCAFRSRWWLTDSSSTRSKRVFQKINEAGGAGILAHYFQ